VIAAALAFLLTACSRREPAPDRLLVGKWRMADHPDVTLEFGQTDYRYAVGSSPTKWIRVYWKSGHYRTKAMA
jgi:hypothetical protein